MLVGCFDGSPMSQVVVSLSTAEMAALPAHSTALARPSVDVLILGGILAVLQILDGALTASGVSLFGLRAEANLLIRIAMEQLGAIPALVLLKGIALLIIGLLCGLAPSVPWVPRALKTMIVIYLVAAIVPWTWIHMVHFLT